jgi:hypothetical protein
LGRSRPNCAKTMLRVDIITERDIRVDHDNFDLVDN